MYKSHGFKSIRRELVEVGQAYPSADGVSVEVVLPAAVKFCVHMPSKLRPVFRAVWEIVNRFGKWRRRYFICVQDIEKVIGRCRRTTIRHLKALVDGGYLDVEVPIGEARKYLVTDKVFDDWNALSPQERGWFEKRLHGPVAEAKRRVVNSRGGDKTPPNLIQRPAGQPYVSDPEDLPCDRPDPLAWSDSDRMDLALAWSEADLAERELQEQVENPAGVTLGDCPAGPARPSLRAEASPLRASAGLAEASRPLVLPIVGKPEGRTTETQALPFVAVRRGVRDKEGFLRVVDALEEAGWGESRLPCGVPAVEVVRVDG